jgi:hypothetical protein
MVAKKVTLLSIMEPSTQPTQFPSPTPPSAPKRSHKKLIIIIASIAALLLIGGGTVGVLLLFKGSNSPAKEETAFDGSGPADPDYVFTPDLSKDYGACTILQKNTIKLALGTVADNLDGPNNVGRVQVAKGDDSQVCSYGFTKSTAENTLNIDNGLTGY